MREWHKRQLGPDHNWTPALGVSLEQWRQRSRLWLIAERERKRLPVTEADLAEMGRAAIEGLAELRQGER